VNVNSEKKEEGVEAQKDIEAEEEVEVISGKELRSRIATRNG
jgi:hypothetical protein